jgi:hypothetical protein
VSFEKDQVISQLLSIVRFHLSLHMLQVRRSLFYLSSRRRQLILTRKSIGPKVSTPSTVSFHFASSEYAACFQDLPVPDIPKLRKSAVDYIDSFDAQTWYNDPVRRYTLLWKWKMVVYFHFNSSDTTLLLPLLLLCM